MALKAAAHFSLKDGKNNYQKNICFPDLKTIMQINIINRIARTSNSQDT